MFSVPEPRPKIEGYIETVVSRYSDEEFRRNFRLHRSTCEKLIADFAASTAYPDRSTHGGTPQKTPEHHILVFLWYAGNKTSIRDVAGRFGVSESTCHAMITRVMTHLCQIAYRVIRFPSGLDKLSSDFEQVSGMPGVIGCIDGSYIPTRCPADKIRSTYINRHGILSITVQGICDHKRRLLDVSVGWPSKIHDGRVFKLSTISKRIPTLFEGAKYHLLGDAAYPCREYLVPPYKDYGNLSPKQHAFNTKLSSTRVLIENIFGILKNRFRQLKVLEFISVERMCQFTMSCCVIHNLCIDGDDLMDPGAPEPTKRTTPYEGEDEVEAALRVLGERKRSALVRMVC
ncbi:putative nuclease HARBI1 [Ixodes scapularis]|uniref:putative nuclease HARBI1 n=1 Tax=Ixodes scapularis TaxID=6945 RepID=UPI001C385497|nr:putative nuclease HARBI1 [Ixodes scapularis]